MKFSYLILTLALTLTFSLTIDTPMQAQHYGYGKKKKKKKKKAEKERSTFRLTDHLWYGGGGNLGFSGGNNFNFFTFGLSPMVGYKIIPQVSVGPRLSFNYNFIKGVGSDGFVHKAQPASYSAGLFTRFKFVRMFFLHAEYEYESREVFYVDGLGYLVLDNEGNILTDRISRENIYAGLGYTNSSDGRWGYEVLLLYNFLTPESSLELPFDLRVGLTYNF